MLHRKTRLRQMLETNTQNNSTLISLSRAAQITGYHQDYLGQLCRLGKLSSIKVGRNWFTFPEAISKLAPSAVEPAVDSSREDVFKEMVENINVIEDREESPLELSAPKIVQNVTISQVEGMPISIRTIAAPPRSMNNVQNILTTLRIEALQREVLELRQLLARLMEEVKNHSTILSARNNYKFNDSLKHSYVSNFDFNTPYSRLNLLEEEQETANVSKLNWQKEKAAPQYSIVAIFSGAAVMVALALMTYSIVSGQFFGELKPQVSTIYYQSKSLAEEPQTVLQPTVAGDTLPPQNVGTQE